MAGDVKATLTELVRRTGSVADTKEYCSVEDMARCMPDFDTMPDSTPLSELHRLALLENRKRQTPI